MENFNLAELGQAQLKFVLVSLMHIWTCGFDITYADSEGLKWLGFSLFLLLGILDTKERPPHPDNWQHNIHSRQKIHLLTEWGLQYVAFYHPTHCPYWHRALWVSDQHRAKDQQATWSHNNRYKNTILGLSIRTFIIVHLFSNTNNQQSVL